MMNFECTKSRSGTNCMLHICEMRDVALRCFFEFERKQKARTRFRYPPRYANSDGSARSIPAYLHVTCENLVKMYTCILT